MTPKPIKRVVPRERVTYEEVRCTKCESPVRMIFDPNVGRPSTIQTSLQPFNGLHLVNHYAYGLKWDEPSMGTGSRDIVLCEPCTELFLMDNKWLEQYLAQA